MKDIQDYKLTDIRLDKIDFDESNPNEMSDEQESALEKSMKKYGFLSPIIVQKKKNGRYSMVDGEHRARKYMQFQRKSIKGYALELSNIELKILRQTMNKLRGKHDSQKDADEFRFLETKGKLALLAELIAQPEETLITEKEDVNMIKHDPDLIQHKEDQFLHGNLKQLHFIFTNKEYTKIMPSIEKFMKTGKFKTHTELFIDMVRIYGKNNSKKA